MIAEWTIAVGPVFRGKILSLALEWLMMLMKVKMMIAVTWMVIVMICRN